MPDNIENRAGEARQRQTLLVAVTFAGLATGFIAFWTTLSTVYPAIFGAIGAVMVWSVAKGRGDPSFALMAAIIFFVTVLIGLGVGIGSSFGTGVPIVGP